MEGRGGGPGPTLLQILAIRLLLRMGLTLGFWSWLGSWLSSGLGLEFGLGLELGLELELGPTLTVSVPSTASFPSTVASLWKSRISLSHSEPWDESTAGARGSKGSVIVRGLSVIGCMSTFKMAPLWVTKDLCSRRLRSQKWMTPLG